MSQTILPGTAQPSQVLSGQTFSAGTNYGAAGSMPNNGAVTITPGTTAKTIPAGYHNGSGTVSGDANLVSGNIKAGTSIFGVNGKSSVVDTATATATAAQILSGQNAYVNGSLVTGSMANQGTLRTQVAGIYSSGYYSKVYVPGFVALPNFLSADGSGHTYGGAVYFNSLDYVVDGTTNGSASSGANLLEGFNYSAQTFTVEAHDTYNREGVVATVDTSTNNILITGGGSGTSSSQNVTACSSSNTITTMASLPNFTIYADGAYDSSTHQHYCIAGLNGSATANNNAYSWSSNSWTSLANVTVSHYYGGGAYDGVANLIYSTGGSGYNSHLAYSTSANSWTQEASLPANRDSFACTFDTNANNMILMSGRDGNNNTSTNIYSHGTNAWTTGPNDPTGNRYECFGTYDPVADCSINFGGLLSSGQDNQNSAYFN